MVFTEEIYQMLKEELISILHNLFQKTEGRGTCSYYFMKLLHTDTKTRHECERKNP